MRRARRGLSGVVAVLLPASVWAGSVEIDSGVVGAPGDSVTFAVRLRDTGQPVVAVQNDIEFTSAAPIAARADGEPDCAVSLAIDKPDSEFSFQPPGCRTGSSCTAIRALVLSQSNLDRIADGSVLYSCRVAIPADAAPGTYPLTAGGVVLVDPDADPLPGAQGVDGSIVVAGDPTTQPVAYVTTLVGVSVIDPVTNQPFALIPLPEQPEFLFLSPDARTLLATAESSAIYVIDTTSRSVRATIVDQPSYASGDFSPDGTLAYVVRFGLSEPVSSVSFVDLADDTLLGSTPLDFDLYPRIAVRPDGRKGYVPRLLHPEASERDFPFDITVIDLETGQVETTIPIPCGLAMYDVAFSPDGSRLYVPVLGSDFCGGLAGGAAGQAACAGDCDDNGSISIDELIRGVNIALGLAALDTCTRLAGGDGSVDIADLIAAVSAALNGCAEPPPGDFAAVIDTSAQELITVIDLGSAAAPGLAADVGADAGIAVQRTEGLGIELSPDGRLGYVTGCRDGVCVVDLERNQVVDTIALPSSVELPEGGTGSTLPLNIAITPDGRRGYVTILISGPPPASPRLDELARLAVLDLDRRELLATIEAPGASDVAVGPLPVVCPIDFGDDNTQTGTPDCLYLGFYNAECGEEPLETTWRSNGQMVEILFQDFDGVFCEARVTSATTAELTACTLDGEATAIGGFVALGFGSSSLAIQPTEAPFLVDECPLDFYLGSLTDVVTPAAFSPR